MDKKILALLENADIQELRDLIKDIHGRDPQLDITIESHLQRNDPSLLHQSINERISRLKRGRAFIDWRSVPAVSRDIDLMTQDIVKLADTAPADAFKLIDKLIATHSSIYRRADDSSGCIGESYQWAVQRWLEIAATCRNNDSLSKNWSLELKKRHLEHNDYAVWDYVLKHSVLLLSKAELKALAQDFEQHLVSTLKKTAGEPLNSDYLPYSTALYGLAAALNDCELYARTTTLISPTPNSIQLTNIIEFCLDQNEPNTALRWYQQGEQTLEHFDDRRLLDRIYKDSGDIRSLTKLRREQYYSLPSYTSLEKLADVVEEKERDALFDAAPDVAFQISELSFALAFLFDLQRLDLAAIRIEQNPDGLADIYYGLLTDIAKQFASDGYALAAALCYRSLLNNILEQGRSKAYTYAARYFRSLVRLDKQIEHYQQHLPHSDYLARLHREHGRKRAFWARVDTGKTAN